MLRGMFRGFMHWRKPTDGWPRHLHHAAQALADEALRVEGNMERIDWGGVEVRTLDSRGAYYGSQRSPAMRMSGSLVAAVMRDVTDGVSRLTDFLNSIKRHQGSAEGVEWQLPRGMHAEDFLDHLVQQGALYESGSGHGAFADPILPQPPDQSGSAAADDLGFHQLRHSLKGGENKESLTMKCLRGESDPGTSKSNWSEILAVPLARSLAKGSAGLGLLELTI